MKSVRDWHVQQQYLQWFFISDELKVAKIDETNPIEDYVENDITQNQIKTKVLNEEQVKYGRNRKCMKSKAFVEQKQFECSECSNVFKSSKM